MIKFKKILENIINERKNIGIVYHFTSFTSASSILAQDFLQARYWKPQFSKDKLIFTISTTRDKHFSKHRRKNNLEPIIGGDQIAFELDGNMMSDKYEVRPYDDTTVAGIKNPSLRQLWGDEMEEVWYGKNIENNEGIKGIKKYIRKIIITKSGYEDIISYSDMGFSADIVGNELTFRRVGRPGPDNDSKERLDIVIKYFESFNIPLRIEKWGN